MKHGASLWYILWRMAHTQIKQSSKILSSKKLTGLNCVSENPSINPAVAVKALFAHGKQNWISGAYIICAKQSHHSFFPLNQNSKPPTDSSGAELNWRIKLIWNSEAFQDNYQYRKPRTSSLMEIFSHLLQAAIFSLPCERLLLSVKKRNSVQSPTRWSCLQ